MRLTHSLSLLSGLASLVLATPIGGREYTKRIVPHIWADGDDSSDDTIAKRQFGYGYGDHDNVEPNETDLAKRLFVYTWTQDDGDYAGLSVPNLEKEQSGYGYGDDDSAEPNEVDLAKRLFVYSWDDNGKKE